MSEDDLFSRRTHVWFPPCAKFSWASDNHTLGTGLVFDSVNSEISMISNLGPKKYLKIILGSLWRKPNKNTHIHDRCITAIDLVAIFIVVPRSTMSLHRCKPLQTSQWVITKELNTPLRICCVCVRLCSGDQEEKNKARGNWRSTNQKHHSCFGVASSTTADCSMKTCVKI